MARRRPHHVTKNKRPGPPTKVKNTVVMYITDFWVGTYVFLVWTLASMIRIYVYVLLLPLATEYVYYPPLSE